MAELRISTPQDAAEVAALTSRLHPDRALGGEELQRQDRDQVAAGAHHGRAVLRGDGGELLGFAAYSQSLGQFHPRKFELALIVDPAWRGQGLGTRLYAWLESQLTPLEPLSLRVSVGEHEPVALRFAQQRGFRESRRFWVSSAEPARVDLRALPDLEAQLEGRGVRLLTAADLAARDPDGWQAQIHALFSEVRLDVPRNEPATPISLAQFREWILDEPGFLPDAYLLAETEADGLIGLSDLYGSPASGDLFIGLSGVRRPWRGLGLATALKLRGLRYALEQQVPRVWTENESGNAAILKINDRLGFVREPAIIALVRGAGGEEAQ